MRGPCVRDSFGCGGGERQADSRILGGGGGGGGINRREVQRPCNGCHKTTVAGRDGQQPLSARRVPEMLITTVANSSWIYRSRLRRRRRRCRFVAWRQRADVPEHAVGSVRRSQQAALGRRCSVNVRGGILQPSAGVPWTTGIGSYWCERRCGVVDMDHRNSLACGQNAGGLTAGGLTAARLCSRARIS